MLNQAAIIDLFRKTVDKAKLAVEKELKHHKKVAASKGKLVSNLLDTDPMKFISAMVKKELGSSKGKGKGKGKNFDVEYGGLVALTMSEEYNNAVNEVF